MAVTLATLSGDVGNLIGADFFPQTPAHRRTKVWVRSNTTLQRIVDTDTGKIHIGIARAKVQTDGTFAFADLVATGSADTNLDDSGDLQYTVYVKAPSDSDSSSRDVVHVFGPYPVTEDADISELEPVAGVDASYASELLAEMQALRDEVVDISGISTSDGVITAIDANPASLFRVQSDARHAASTADMVETVGAELFAPLAGNIDATVRKLADDNADVNILVLGDSTAAQSGQFPDELMPDVQALYPHRTLQKATWDNTGHAWGSFSTVGSSGSGSFKIKFWQGAVSGTVCEQPLNYFDAWVGVVQPDLVIVHHGHNYGKNASDGGQPSDAVMDYVFRERYLRFVAEVKKICPDADVLLTSQNPYLTSGARTEMSNIRAQAIRKIAADLGCAYGPVLEAYLATGSPATYLGGDLLHPNTAGAQLAAATLLPLFRIKDNHEITARNPSPLVTPGTNLLTNGDFIEFGLPPTLTGWTAANATLSKDSTNYESANGYSVKGTCTAATVGQAYQSLPIRKIRGRVITFLARFYVEAAVTASGPGRVQLSGDGGFVTISSGTITSVRDNWVWAFVTGYVPAGSSFITASLLFGNNAGEYASCDRAVVVLGHMPRDAAPRAALTTYVNQVASTEDSLTSGQMVPRRDLMQVNSVSHATGTLGLTFFTGDKTETINNVTAYTGSTAAAATPSLCRIGIYSVDGSGNLTLVASTPNDTALFAATTTAYQKALSASFSKVAGQRYAVGLLVISAAAMPTFMGPLAVSNPVAQASNVLEPKLTARLTGQTDLPSSIAVGSLVSYSQRVHVLLS